MRAPASIACIVLLLACARTEERAAVVVRAPPTATETPSPAVLAADDGAAPSVDCYRFYYGIGVTPDAVRARRCFERAVRVSPCGDELTPSYLAAMRWTGEGGPSESVSQGLVCGDALAFDAIARAPRGAHLDFCRDVGGTTLSMIACTRIDRRRAEQRFVDWRRKVDPLGGADAHAKLARASAAFEAFVDADANRAADAFRGGSLERLTYSGWRPALIDARVAALEAGAATMKLSDAERLLEQRQTAARAGLDREGLHLFDESVAAFDAYVQAEIDAAVARGDSGEALRARLVHDRAESLAPMDE